VNSVKADEGAVACRVDLSRRSSAKTEAKRRLEDGEGHGVQFGYDPALRVQIKMVFHDLPSKNFPVMPFHELMRRLILNLMRQHNQGSAVHCIIVAPVAEVFLQVSAHLDSKVRRDCDVSRI